MSNFVIKTFFLFGLSTKIAAKLSIKFICKKIYYVLVFIAIFLIPFTR